MRYRPSPMRPIVGILHWRYFYSLGRVCLSHVKVVCWHVLERHILQVSVSWYKLVT